MARRQLTQLLRFCIVGFANMTVDFAVFFVLTYYGMRYLPAQVLSYSAGVVNSFILNRTWTFRLTSRPQMAEIVKFCCLNGASLGVSTGILFIAQDMFQLNLWLGKLAATAGGVAVNFIGSRCWVFRRAAGE